MKKLIPVLVFAVAMSFGSCKKDYTCKCTGVPVLGTYSFVIPDSKKSDAEDACDLADNAGGSCELE